jgi:hypothetical protein
VPNQYRRPIDGLLDPTQPRTSAAHARIGLGSRMIGITSDVFVPRFDNLSLQMVLLN